MPLHFKGLSDYLLPYQRYNSVLVCESFGDLDL